jgi:hypothetical protein
VLILLVACKFSISPSPPALEVIFLLAVQIMISLFCSKCGSVQGDM